MQQETDVRQGGPDPAAGQLPPADWAAADEMRRRTFTVAEQGYSQEEVKAYLTHLAEVFANQAAQLAELKRAASEVPKPVAQNGGEDPSGLATKIADVLKEAEEHAARLRVEAEGEAKLILAGAQQRAERSQREANERAERARRDAEERAQQRVSEAQEQARQAGGQAEAAVREAKQKATEAEAMRDAVLAELRGAFERISQLARPEQPQPPVVSAPGNPAPSGR